MPSKKRSRKSLRPIRPSHLHLLRLHRLEVIEVEDDIEVEDQPNLFDQEMDVDVEIETQAYIPEEPVIKRRAERAEIFVVVEQMPEFPGGDKALYEFLAKTSNTRP